MIGNILKSKGEFEKAIKINQDILEKDPKNIDASYNIHNVIYLQKNTKKLGFSMSQDTIYKI